MPTKPSLVKSLTEDKPLFNVVPDDVYHDGFSYRRNNEAAREHYFRHVAQKTENEKP